MFTKRSVRSVRAVLIAAAIACLGPITTAQATPVDNTPPVLTDGNGVSPTSSTVQSGNTLGCYRGEWNHASSFKYKFRRDGVDITAFVTNNTQYFTTRSDTGHNIDCVVRATDATDNTTADAPSQNSVLIVPRAALTITRYSASVTGNIGTDIAGITVTGSLRRAHLGGDPLNPGVTGTFTATTTSTGSWAGLLTDADSPTALRPAPYLPGDTVVVHYSGSGTLPADTTYVIEQFSWDQRPANLDKARIAADGTFAEWSTGFQCSQVQFRRGSAALVATTEVRDASNQPYCRASFSPPLTDEDAVSLYAADNSRSNKFSATVISPLGLPGNGFGGVPGGAPTCSGDLVTGSVACDRLKPGTFTITRSRGGATANFTVGSADAGHGVGQLPGLQAGDTVTLREQGGTRALTTLRLSRLRLDVGTTGAVTAGDCAPHRWLPGAGAACPSNGLFTSALAIPEPDASAEGDDLSGGRTTVTLPVVTYLGPPDGTYVQTPFQAYADTSGPAPSAITLTLYHRNVDGSDGAQAGDPIAVDPAAGGAVGSLTPGRYNAVWRIADTQGDGTTHDTRVLRTQFVVEPGSGSGEAASAQIAQAQTPQAQTAEPLPSVPDARGDSRAPATTQVRCRHTGKSKPRTRCVVTLATSLTGRIQARLLRGGRVYARGTSSRGRRLVLRGNRRIPQGRYKLVIARTRAGHYRTLTLRVRV